MSSNLYMLLHSVVPLCVNEFQTTLERKTQKRVESLMLGENEHPQIWKPSERELLHTYMPWPKADLLIIKKRTQIKRKGVSNKAVYEV